MILARLDDHPDPGTEDDQLQQMADRAEFVKSRAIGSDEEHGRDHPIDDQPDHE